MTSLAAAQPAHCPDPEDDALRALGPTIRTNQQDVTTVICRYFEGQKLAGLTIGKYVQNYKFGDDLCHSTAYMESSIRSKDHQALASYKDTRANDNYPAEFWEELAYRMVEKMEDWALPCDVDKKMFIHPLEIRKPELK